MKLASKKQSFYVLLFIEYSICIRKITIFLLNITLCLIFYENLDFIFNINVIIKSLVFRNGCCIAGMQKLAEDF